MKYDKARVFQKSSSNWNAKYHNTAKGDTYQLRTGTPPATSYPLSRPCQSCGARRGGGDTPIQGLNVNDLKVPVVAKVYRDSSCRERSRDLIDGVLPVNSGCLHLDTI